MSNKVFGGIFSNKKVLITGNTGFKGSWLTTWLLNLNADVYGISNTIPTEPSMFKELNLESKINHTYIDIRDYEKLSNKISEIAPDFIFHLAAQPIVSLSYADPVDTISSNVLGTTHVLESIRQLKNKCVAVIITSDKCYENIEQIWGYKETDQLGGKDIYSGSKGAAELIFHSYFHSFFVNKHPNIRLASARAGNVIGGGDWAKDRIVVDCMKSWSKSEKVTIRSPKATRPWQHVLEPLSGYLRLAEYLYDNFDTTNHNGDSFNFGPRSEQNHTVLRLLTDLSKYWDFKDVKEAFEVTDNIPFHEAGLLKLNCEKAHLYLKWEPNLNYNETIEFVSTWYYKFYKGDDDIYQFTQSQLKKYEEIALSKGMKWIS